MNTAVAEPIITHAPTRPVEVVPEVRQVSRGCVSIISRWPAPLRARRRHNGITFYAMAAAPRGSYSKLVVYDTQEWINIPNENSMRGESQPRAISAPVVASCLVTQWAGDTLGAKSGHRPGIGVIAGEGPTEAELRALDATQNALFNWYISDGNSKYISGEGVNISDTHRLAAKYMLDRGAEKLLWFPVVQFASVKECPACAKQIEAKALRCEHCTTMLPKFYIEELGFDPADDPIVLAAIQRIRLVRENAASKNDSMALPVPVKDPRVVGQPKG